MKATCASPIALAAPSLLLAFSLSLASVTLAETTDASQINGPAKNAAEPSPRPAAEAQANLVLSLDGQSGCMSVADAPALHSLSNALTLELWFKLASFYQNQGAVNSLLRKNVAANSENFFLRFRTINDKPWVEVSPGSDIGVVRASYDFALGQWYHLAATYDGSNVRLFVNGVVIKTEPLSGAMAIDASELFIGCGDPEYSSGEYFEGALDEVRIWNVVRAPAEIVASRSSPLSGHEPGLVAYWNFDDGTARDLSGHGLNGVLKGHAEIVQATRAAALAESQPKEPVRPAELTPSKRLETLEDLWKKLSDIYPALEYKGIRGRTWIEPAIERVRQAKNDEEFYGVLLELMASLKDTHTRIASYPGQLVLQGPPVFLNEVEGEVAVIKADASTGLSPGNVIVAIDGKPVKKCLATQIQRVCNSTDRGRIREACGQLLRGRPGSTVTVTVRGSGPATRDVTLHRESKALFWSEPTISSRRISDSLGYIRIASWGGKDLAAKFDQALEEFKSCAGLIIDVRGNGGGSDQLADDVNGRLTDHPVVSSIDFWREEGTDQYHRTVGWVQPRGPWVFPGRVAVLIDEGCASACEHFVSGVEAMGRVLLVGGPTNGAGGGPTVVTLCDGTKVVISRALGLRVNGVVFEGHGIPPHIMASPLLEDLRQIHDPALEQAKEWLLSDKPVPPRPIDQ
jgi:C-terminal processing protease CtpA/Prc